MGPKLLGGCAALLAAAFILALPSIFEGEPADEVEPIRFGPPPVTGLAAAVQVTAPPPRQGELDPAGPAFRAQPVTPVIVSGSGGDGGTAAAGAERDMFSERPGDDMPEDRDEDEERNDDGERNVVEEEEDDHEDEATGEEATGDGTDDDDADGASADEGDDSHEDEADD